MAGGIIRGAMADPVPAATTRSGGPGPSNRAWLTWLVVLLAVHAGLAAWAVTQTPETPWYLYRYDGVLRVSLIALAAFGVAIVVWGRFTHAIAWNGGILVAASLLTPVVTAMVTRPSRAAPKMSVSYRSPTMPVNAGGVARSSGIFP